MRILLLTTIAIFAVAGCSQAPAPPPPSTRHASSNSASLANRFQQMSPPVEKWEKGDICVRFLLAPSRKGFQTDGEITQIHEKPADIAFWKNFPQRGDTYGSANGRLLVIGFDKTPFTKGTIIRRSLKPIERDGVTTYDMNIYVRPVGAKEWPEVASGRLAKKTAEGK